MAKADNNVILSHLSGSIGDQLTVRQSNGTTIVSKKQKKRKKRSTEKQLAAQGHFRESTRKAKWLLRDPDMEAFYQSKAGPGLTAYNMAFKDAYNPPEIRSITTTEYFGIPGDKIVVRAIDVFRVFRVTVAIYSATDVLQEQGDAIIARNGKDWTYTATKDNKGLKGLKIKVMAEDVPENKTYSEIIL
jgi:hypothetical protein